MLSSTILSYTTFAYFGVFMLYLIMMVMNRAFFGRLASLVLGLGFIAQTTAIILRWVESYRLGIGHAPFSNMYESLIFFAWVICLSYIIIEIKYGNRIIGAFITPLAFLAMAYASLKDATIQPLLPALKSNWLIAHVITCFIGYAAFALAFGINLENRRAFPGNENAKKLVIIPLLAGFLDYLENILVLTQILSYPSLSEIIIMIASAVTSMKWAILMLGFGVVFILIPVVLYRIFFRRFAKSVYFLVVQEKGEYF